MVRDYAFRARRCLREAELAVKEDDYPGTVRRAQEALEVAVKAVLRHFAIEYPREHDVGDALTLIEEKVPENLRRRLPRLRNLMSELARARGPAFYGYEVEGVPPSRAFSREYAEGVFKEVTEIVKRLTVYVGA